MSEIYPVITLDGPSGTGKGTISQLLAQELGWNYLDSGAMYRVLALAAEQHGVEFDNEASLGVLAEHLDVQFKATRTGDASKVTLEGEDVSHTIRTEGMGNSASKIGIIPGVRLALLTRLRAFREQPGLVTDGRDMGTVVFPDAQLKIYLDATRVERAERRQKQLKEKGMNGTIEQILAKIAERDQRDKQRLVAPLKPADDAVIIDTTGMSIEAVLARIMVDVRSVFAGIIDESTS